MTIGGVWYIKGDNKKPVTRFTAWHDLLVDVCRIYAEIRVGRWLRKRETNFYFFRLVFNFFCLRTRALMINLALNLFLVFLFCYPCSKNEEYKIRSQILYIGKVYTRRSKWDSNLPHGARSDGWELIENNYAAKCLLFCARKYHTHIYICI